VKSFENGVESTIAARSINWRLVQDPTIGQYFGMSSRCFSSIMHTNNISGGGILLHALNSMVGGIGHNRNNNPIKSSDFRCARNQLRFGWAVVHFLLNDRVKCDWIKCQLPSLVISKN